MSRLALRASLLLAAALHAACVGSGGAPRQDAQVAPGPRLDLAALGRCSPLADHDFAFTSNAEGNAEIYLYQARDRAVRNLTNNEAQDHWASWSPDGRFLAFQSLRDGNREVYVLDVESGSTRNLTNHPEQDLLPAWSPDGARIAFFSSRDEPWPGSGPLGGHVFVVTPDGSDLRRLETDPFLSTSGLVWSIDGTRLYYARFAPGRAGLYGADVESGRETEVLRLTDAAPGIAALSPAGDELVYYLEQEVGADLFVLSLDSDATYRLTNDTMHHYYASFSPDGGFLLTTSAADAEGRDYDIRCLGRDGRTNIAVISGSSDARSAAWRPGSTPVRSRR